MVDILLSLQLFSTLAGAGSHLPNMTNLRGNDGKFELNVTLLMQHILVQVDVGSAILVTEFLRLAFFFAFFIIGGLILPKALLSNIADLRFEIVAAEGAFLLLSEPGGDTLLMEAVLHGGRIGWVTLVQLAVEDFECLARLEFDKTDAAVRALIFPHAALARLVLLRRVYFV